MNEPLTVKLNNGVEVLGKLYKGEPSALHYANFTQARKKADAMGEGWTVYHPGVPFYVRKVAN